MGAHVTLIRNVTDVDDKVLAVATEREPWCARAYCIAQEFTRLFAALGGRCRFILTAELRFARPHRFCINGYGAMR